MIDPLSAQVAIYWALREQIEALASTQLDHVLAGSAHVSKGCA